MTAEGSARAKINLALHVVGRRADGYHLLDSLVVFVDISDRITVRAAEDLSLVVTGPYATGVPVDETNLAMKAARLLAHARGVKTGAAITLVKHLPHGGGIGGGSSDAATTLKLLADLWNVSPLAPDAVLTLGADLPVCMYAPSPCFMAGIGDAVTIAPPLPQFWLVLVNPGVHVPTGAVFAALDDKPERQASALERFGAGLDSDRLQDWLRAQRNDLTAVSADTKFAPVIGQVLGELRASAGCGVANMSGSGSTCWGFFKSKQDAIRAQGLIAADHPDWWVKSSGVAGISEPDKRSNSHAQTS